MGRGWGYSNDDDVIIHCLVATLLSVTWDLKMALSFLFCCDVALAMLAVLIVDVGDRCEWWPLVMVMVVVVK